MNAVDLRALVPLWQQRLGLTHWMIETKVGEPENGELTVFEIQRHENAHRAIITIPPWVDAEEPPPADFAETVDDAFIEAALVHELCHLIFRDVVFTVRDDVEELLGQVAHALLMRQLQRHEEAAVDMLSRSLVAAWPS